MDCSASLLLLCNRTLQRRYWQECQLRGFSSLLKPFQVKGSILAYSMLRQEHATLPSSSCITRVVQELRGHSFDDDTDVVQETHVSTSRV